MRYYDGRHRWRHCHQRAPPWSAARVPGVARRAEVDTNARDLPDASGGYLPKRVHGRRLARSAINSDQRPGCAPPCCSLRGSFSARLDRSFRAVRENPYVRQGEVKVVNEPQEGYGLPRGYSGQMPPRTAFRTFGQPSSDGPLFPRSSTCDATCDSGAMSIRAPSKPGPASSGAHIRRITVASRQLNPIGLAALVVAITLLIVNAAMLKE